MATVWVIPEIQNGAVKPVSYELLSMARSIAADGSVVAVLVGTNLDTAAADLAERGANQVLVLENAEADAFSTDGFARAIAGAVADRKPDIVAGAATFRGRDLAARVGAELGVPVAQDVTSITMTDGRVQATRPIYAGKAIATVQIDSDPQMLTVRPNSFPPATETTSGEIEKVQLSDYVAGAKVSETVTSSSDRPDVAEADIIVSGGRGMGGPEHFAMLEELADELGAAVGASRAVVDAGWRPHAEQVGQTGKTVAPSLYVACGISGAVQHLAGMKTSKYVVAINKDPDAPIFSVADYGIVGDVFKVVPELTAAIREFKARH